jgi:hypothetical protein
LKAQQIKILPAKWSKQLKKFQTKKNKIWNSII